MLFVEDFAIGVFVCWFVVEYCLAVGVVWKLVSVCCFFLFSCAR